MEILNASDFLWINSIKDDNFEKSLESEIAISVIGILTLGVGVLVHSR